MICRRSGTFLDEGLGDRCVTVDFGWPGDSSRSVVACGSCAASLISDTPHNNAIRIPTHRPGVGNAPPVASVKPARVPTAKRRRWWWPW